MIKDIASWKARLQQIVEDYSPNPALLIAYKLELTKKSEDEQFRIQALYLDRFWETYDDPNTAPTAVLQEVLRVIPTYKLRTLMSKSLFERIVQKNESLIKSPQETEKAKQQQAEETEKLQRVQQTLQAEEEKLQQVQKKLKEEQEKLKQIEERLQAEEDKKRQEEAKKRVEKEAQERIEAEEKRRKDEEEKRARVEKQAEKERRRQEEEKRVEEKRQKKEDKKLLAAQQAQKAKEAEAAAEQARLAKLKIDEEKREQERQAQEAQRQEQKRLQNIADSKLAEEKRLRIQEEKKERHEKEAKRQEEAAAAKLKREEALTPLRKAKKALSDDLTWKVDSFVNLMDTYDKTPDKQKKFLNGSSDQMVFLNKILAFIEKHQDELNGRTLKEILTEIEQHFEGSLKAASEKPEIDYTFVYQKPDEALSDASSNTFSQTQTQTQTQTQIKEPNLFLSMLNLEVAHLQSVLKRQLNREEVEAVKQTLLSSVTNFNPMSASTLFLLSSIVYAGGFFFNKVVNTYIAAPASFSYGATTAFVFTPYIKITYKIYQQNLSRIRINKAKNALINSSEWRVELFLDYMEQTTDHVKKHGGFQEEYKDPKMKLLEQVINIHSVYGNKTKRALLDDQGLSLFESLIAIHDSLESASENILFLSQTMNTHRDFSNRGIRINNYLIHYQTINQIKLNTAEDKGAALKFIQMITSSDKSLGEMYLAMYNYAKKDQTAPVVLKKQHRQVDGFNVFC